MNKLYILILLLFVGSFSKAQSFCDNNGNIALFSNYDGGILRINVDVNIPNLKIGIVSYENDSVILTGPFLSNVTQVVYAGYFVSSNVHCSPQPKTKTINGAPAGTDTVIYYPTATYNNSNGWPAILCNYSCDINSNQGGCNTADQIADYFFNVFGSTKFLFHYTQYGCWTGIHNISAGGNCCAIAGAVPPAAAFQADDSSVCANNCVFFTDNSAGNPTSWKWTFNGGTPATSTAQNPIVCYFNAGTYDVKLVVSNSGGSDSSDMTGLITVFPSPPIPNLYLSNDTLCSSIDSSGYTYQWYKDGVVIPGATGPCLVITDPCSNYDLAIKDSNGCQVAVGINTICAGMNEYGSDKNLIIKPNPVREQLLIYGLSGDFKIYNIMGECVYAGTKAEARDVSVEASGWPAGVYFVKLNPEAGDSVIKFLKE